MPERESARIADALARHRPQRRPIGELREAAVLVPLIQGPAGLELLFTMRPDTMKVHAAQPSFPGGRVEPSDEDRRHTALRETEEELGLSPSNVRLIGRIDDYVTVTSYHVVPWVGLVAPDAVLRPDEREVARTFSVPLRFLLEPANRRTIRLSRADEERAVYFYGYQGEVVWGATGAMLANFLEIVGATG